MLHFLSAVWRQSKHFSPFIQRYQGFLNCECEWCGYSHSHSSHWPLFAFICIRFAFAIDSHFIRIRIRGIFRTFAFAFYLFRSVGTRGALADADLYIFAKTKLPYPHPLYTLIRIFVFSPFPSNIPLRITHPYQEFKNMAQPVNYLPDPIMKTTYLMNKTDFMFLPCPLNGWC